MFNRDINNTMFDINMLGVIKKTDAIKQNQINESERN